MLKPIELIQAFIERCPELADRMTHVEVSYYTSLYVKNGDAGDLVKAEPPYIYTLRFYDEWEYSKEAKKGPSYIENFKRIEDYREIDETFLRFDEKLTKISCNGHFFSDLQATLRNIENFKIVPINSYYTIEETDEAWGFKVEHLNLSKNPGLWTLGDYIKIVESNLDLAREKLKAPNATARELAVRIYAPF